MAPELLHAELDELESVIRDQAPTQEQEARAEATSKELGKAYHPSQVPYINDAYTYQDRQDELELLLKLLDFRKSSVIAELQAVREINTTRSYPNIAFQH